jgi:hypothetical protein
MNHEYRTLKQFDILPLQGEVPGIWNPCTYPCSVLYPLSHGIWWSQTGENSDVIPLVSRLPRKAYASLKRKNTKKKKKKNGQLPQKRGRWQG